MTTNLLKNLLLPIFCLFIYIVFDYIFTFILASGFDLSMTARVTPFINSYFSLNSQLFLGTIPTVLITLLFSLQYSLTSINLENIKYVLFTVVLALIINKIIFGVCYPWFFGFLSFNMNNYPAGVIIPVMLYLAVAFTLYCIGVFSHFYFNLTKRQAVVVIFELKYIKLSIAAVYAILTILTYSYYPANLPYGMRFPINEGSLLYGLVSFVVLFFYYFSWAFDHLANCHDIDNYAYKTINAFMLNAIFAAIMSVIISCIIFFITLFFSILIYKANAGNLIIVMFFLCIIVSYVMGIILVVKVANKVNTRLYKIFHYCIFGFITLAFMYIKGSPSAMALMGSFGPTLFCLSCYLWLSNCITKKALDRAFGL